MRKDPAGVAGTVVELLRAGRFDALEELFAPRLRAVVSAGTVRVAWQVELDRRGGVRAVDAPVTEPADAGLVRVSVPVTCARGALTVVMSVDGDGLLHGLRLAAPSGVPWTPPRYARTRRFTEHDVTVGAGPLAVGGTVSVPRCRGPHPGVVLLAGGGPFDRDGTTGANRPLKDLAWGLAGRGVAVLRFDKVTHTHPRVAAAGFTMREEYVPHAVAAVDLLRREPGVDPGRVAVLGHSLGGKAAPRVAAAEPAVAGLVLLAAEAQPMRLSAVRVVRHLAALRPGPDADAAVAAITRQAALAGGPDLTPATPAADLPLGLPASYWLDERDYDPVAATAALDLPVLLVQGGRDYQVTVADDLARWRAGLAHRPGVTVHVHDAGNHLFFPGRGPSTPAEYEPAQHVDRSVVTAVADWLTRLRTAAPAGRAGSTR
ncbi:alpha/beta hydrolase [Dactylosporangium aurantiacum]|uniref:Alpha/beta hydrolase n=1 Tax=Dactylosporangium aurantiacum TaxID=35754 RepID=A0A9Q9IR08_9ACTN|nr:alpha/beta fold hydrolase [Dactylosporangium aurantiacum]MDG6103278.1 alpha/beta fold hydrolase [Dactylosporangium aurantiacum]UWZ57780.1 alpha/beta hydrolase [Dactylosporangium aurantiacum]